ncbi:hypothetical protein [Roseicyclus amphidinii]|uniref:hypothetical protein n=1 Tax=Roseicyclus amphidinii TaxID=3034232 RepID=UPI0024E14597|nr:hypothetical protein [Roseicyclus sp. Amp-Y-6]
MPIVVQVWFHESIRTALPGHRPVFHLIEVPFDTLDAFLAEVERDTFIRGTHLLVKWAEGHRHVREVTARKPLTFRGSSVHRVTLSRWPIIDRATA